MKQFKYIGPHDVVEVDGVGTVTRGDVVDVDGELAAGLEQQPDNWQPTKAAKKAATPPPSNEPPAEPGDDTTEES